MAASQRADGDSVTDADEAATAGPRTGRKAPQRTDDGRYVLIDGRRWRATNPALPEARRRELVRELMSARRAVALAKRAGDPEAERRARHRVHAAKVALGERGPKWWAKAESKNKP